MEAEIRVARVRTFETKSGNTGYVAQDENGKEYTTFRPPIGEAARTLEGRDARIKFHEQERNGFTNVYLDAIEPVSTTGEAPCDEEQADEVAWKTAVDAAPWLLGSERPEDTVEPDELYERLKPFKERVAKDIKGD
jgi:hypothetical protein